MTFDTCLVSAGILATIDDPFFGLAVDPLSEFFFVKQSKSPEFTGKVKHKYKKNIKNVSI